MQKEDISFVVHETILHFGHKIDIPLVEFVDKERFVHLLDYLETKKHPDMTPCFVATMRGGSVIYVCREVVESLTASFSRQRKQLFVEAVIIHELFHIYNGIKIHSADDLAFSEAIVHKEMRAMYPRHAKLLDSFHKKL